MSALEFIKKLVIACASLLCAVPEKEGRCLAGLLGLSAWRLCKSERQRIEDTIDRIYFRLNKTPIMPVSQIVKNTFVHFALASYELMLSKKMTKDDVNARIKLFNTHLADIELAKNKGIILALPHIGNWELLGRAIVEHGYALNSFFMAQKENEIGSLLDYFRTFSKIKLHDRDRGGIKALRALKNGECLGMIADQDGSQNGVYLDFLGHMVSVPAGPANWSIKTGAALMPVYSVRRSLFGRYDAYFLPPITDNGAKTHTERVIERTKKLVEFMEELIFKYPHQYLWFYNRFKPRHEAFLTRERQERGYIFHGQERYSKPSHPLPPLASPMVGEVAPT